MTERPGFDSSKTIDRLVEQSGFVVTTRWRISEALAAAFNAGEEAGRASRVPPDSEAVKLLREWMGAASGKVDAWGLSRDTALFLQRIDACLAGE